MSGQWTPERRRRQSERMKVHYALHPQTGGFKKGDPCNTGLARTPELEAEKRRKISVALTGKIHTLETRRKRTESLKRYYATHEHHCKGVTNVMRYGEEGARELNARRGAAISSTLLMQGTWNTGVPRSKETRAKISKSMKRVWQEESPEKKHQRFENIRNAWNNPELRNEDSERMKMLWQNPEFREKTTVARLEALRASPNKKELLLESIIQKHGFPFEYVGDWSLAVDGLNPDFICAERGLIVEHYGCHWHGCPEHRPDGVRYKRSMERIARLEFHGYRVLVIWEHELVSIYGDLPDHVAVARKIRDFMGAP